MSGWKYLNSLLMASFHRVFPFCSTILQASLTVLGIWVQNLWVRFHYLALTLYIIQYWLLSVSEVHHVKSGFIAILFATKYSAVITGYLYLRYFNGIQDVSPSFHFTSNLQPFVVQLMCMLPLFLGIQISPHLTAGPSLQWSINSSNR